MIAVDDCILLLNKCLPACIKNPAPAPSLTWRSLCGDRRVKWKPSVKVVVRIAVTAVHCSSPFYMYIKPQSDPKLVVDVRGADSKPGAKVILYTDKGDLADNQLWYEDERGVVRSKMNGFAVDTSGYLVSFFV